MPKKTGIAKTGIPFYQLEGFRSHHRRPDDTSSFGYNNLSPAKMIPGFELYSSAGIKPGMGPLKSAFYRINITISGTLDIYIGLEHFQHQPCTVCFTYPGQVFAKSNISADAFGYYLLFNPGFLDELVPHNKITAEFPFLDAAGTPFFRLSAEEINRVESFVLQMDEELQSGRIAKEKAVKMYLYLLLLECKRSYERQQLHTKPAADDGVYLVSRYHKLVGLHFLAERKVSGYAAMLGVTANHLNRVVKEFTGKTASEAIDEMLLQEAKAVLRYTDASIAEIAYQLSFSEPAAFSRFFKKLSGETPVAYREKA